MTPSDDFNSRMPPTDAAIRQAIQAMASDPGRFASERSFLERVLYPGTTGLTPGPSGRDAVLSRFFYLKNEAKTLLDFEKILLEQVIVRAREIDMSNGVDTRNPGGIAAAAKGTATGVLVTTILCPECDAYFDKEGNVLHTLVACPTCGDTYQVNSRS